jgi:hypothetical protein
MAFFVPTGTLTFAGVAPLGNLRIAPQAGALALTGVAPTLAIFGRVPTLTGVVTLTGQQPLVAIGVAPATAALTITGRQPLVNSLTTLTPVTGAVAFASTPSAVNTLNVVVPLTGTLALAGAAPTLGRSGFAAPGTGLLAVAGQKPQVQVTTSGQITPDTGGINLDGQPSVIVRYPPDSFFTVVGTGADSFIVQGPG